MGPKTNHVEATCASYPRTRMSQRATPYDIVFLSLLTATPALATDMYLPAMPALVEQWNSTKSVISLSLVLWFAAFSIFLLVWGPISDRVGRRPVLLVGLAIFVIASFLCATSSSPLVFILSRVLQGTGAASPSTMVMAICRDRFEGTVRQKVLGFIGIVMPIVPMVAPMIGAAMMTVASWRWIFVSQGSLAFLSLVLSWYFQETAAIDDDRSLLESFLRYGRLLANGRFMAANTTMGLGVGPLFGFIAFSTFLYQEIFGLSEVHFALLFGLNAVAGMTGAAICIRLAARISQYRLLTASFVGSLLGGIGILTAGGLSPFVFAAFMAIVSVSIGLSRPLSNHIILEQVTDDIGAASSFLVFYQGIVGAICMGLVGLPWSAPITFFGLMVLVLSTAILVVWPFLLKALRGQAA